MLRRGLLLNCPMTRLSITVAVILVALLTSAGSAHAQDKQGPYVAQASKRLVNLVSKANDDGYKLQDNKLSIGGAWIKQGNDNWVTLYAIVLEKGTPYRFLAAGDDDARDVDIQVLDGNGKVMAADVKNDPDAVVDFTPPASQQYQVRVRLYASRDNLPCVCLGIVMSK